MSFESSENALHFYVCVHAYLITVAVANCGKPNIPQKNTKVFNIVNRTSCRSLQQMNPLWAQKDSLFVNLCIGYFLGVVVYKNRPTAVGIEISALYNIIPLNYVLLFLRLLTDIKKYLQKPLLGFTLMDCEHVGAKYAWYGCVLPKRSKFLQNPIFCCYESNISNSMGEFDIYGFRQTGTMQTILFHAIIFDVCTFRLKLTTQATKRPLLAAVLRAFPCFL